MKKKLLIAIANYGDNQEKYLMRMLKEFNSFKKYDISVILLNTKKLANLKYPKLKIQQKIFPLEIRNELPNQHKEIFFKEKDNFDLFLYAENDVLIKEKHLDYFLREMKFLNGTKFIPGFMRWEENENGEKFLMDSPPQQGGATRRNFIKLSWEFFPKSIFNLLCLIFEKTFVIKKVWKIRGKDYFEIQNNHQAFYLINKRQLNKNIIPNRKKIKSCMFCSPKVTAASFPYFRKVSGLIKIMPINNLEDVLIHHMPNKYANISNFRYPLKKIKELLK